MEPEEDDYTPKCSHELIRKLLLTKNEAWRAMANMNTIYSNLVEQVDGYIVQLEKDIDRLNVDLVHTKSERERYRQERNDLQKCKEEARKTKEANEQFNKLLENEKNYQEKHAKLKAEYDEAKKQYSRTDVALTAKKNEFDQLMDKSARQDSKIKNLTIKIDEMALQLKSLTTERDMLKETERKSKAELMTACMDLSKLRKENDKLKKELANHSAKKANAQPVENSKKDEESNKLIAFQKDQIQKLQTESKKLEQAIHNLEYDLDTERNRCHKLRLSIETKEQEHFRVVRSLRHRSKQTADDEMDNKENKDRPSSSSAAFKKVVADKNLDTGDLLKANDREIQTEMLHLPLKTHLSKSVSIAPSNRVSVGIQADIQKPSEPATKFCSPPKAVINPQQLDKVITPVVSNALEKDNSAFDEALIAKVKKPSLSLMRSDPVLPYYGTPRPNSNPPSQKERANAGGTSDGPSAKESDDDEVVILEEIVAKPGTKRGTIFGTDVLEASMYKRIKREKKFTEAQRELLKNIQEKVKPHRLLAPSNRQLDPSAFNHFLDRINHYEDWIEAEKKDFESSLETPFTDLRKALKSKNLSNDAPVFKDIPNLHSSVMKLIDAYLKKEKEDAASSSKASS